MTSSDPGRERRRNRRRDVSLPARFTSDARTIHRAVVRSLSAEGMFLETAHLVPIRATIRIVAPLPDEGREPLRVQATVLYHNRRGIAGAVSGFGLQFTDASDALRDRIERLLDREPALVPTDGLGTIAWPVEVPTIDPGWHAIAWWSLDPETAEIEASASRPEPTLDRLLRWLAATPEDIAAGPDGRVAFHFAGKPLAPSMGLRRAWLGREAVQRALAAQMWAIEILDAVEWRLIDVSREQAAALGATGRVLDAAREALASVPAHEIAVDANPSLDDGGTTSGAEPEAIGHWHEVLIAFEEAREFLEVLRYNLQGLPLLDPGSAGVTEPRTDAYLRGGAADATPATPRTGTAAPAAPAASPARPAARARWRSRSATMPAAIAVLLVAALVAFVTRSRPPETYVRYLPTAREALGALGARNAMRLDDRLSAASAALGAESARYASHAALELGLATLRRREALVAQDTTASDGPDAPWGPGRRHPDRESYERERDRARTRADGWIDTCEQIARQILLGDAPFARERDPALHEVLREGRAWLTAQQRADEPSS